MKALSVTIPWVVNTLFLPCVIVLAVAGLPNFPLVLAAEKPSVQAKASIVSLDTDAHLVGWWRFDETSGQTAADSSKAGHPATLEGGLAFEKCSVAGRLGQAIELKGGSELLRVKGYKGVTGPNPRTVAVWIKTKDQSGDLVTWGTNDAGKMFVMGHIRGRIGITPKGGYLYMNADLNDGAWHHVAAVLREGSPPNLHDQAQLFKDGEPIEPDGIGLLDLLPFETGDQLDVCAGRNFKGAIDDLRIYDRALTEEEVKALATPTK
jgi:hypothetical protein